MERTRLQSKFLQSKTDRDKKLYAKQQNDFASLLRKSKKSYYEKLNINDICSKKLFWKTIKTLLSDKIVVNEKLTLEKIF